MSFEIVPAHDLPLREQASVFNRAFAGYLAGWTDIDVVGLAKLISVLDLCYSRFVRVNGALTGFGYINRTGNVSRLASMGVVPDARGSGAAGFLLAHLLGEAKSRTDEAMVLEVFEQNLPALTLYRQNKFRELTRLFGWRRPAGKIETQFGGDLEEISLLAASQIRSPLDFPDLPWQISRHAVVKLPETYSYRIDNCCVVVSDPKVTPTRIFALLGYDGSNGTAVRNVVSQVLNRFPNSEFFAREVFPEKLNAEVFEPLGFAREPLNQFLMRHDLQ
jgi:ribosomal protein S18 acetylase RimI-like enzyme